MGCALSRPSPPPQHHQARSRLSRPFDANVPLPLYPASSHHHQSHNNKNNNRAPTTRRKPQTFDAERYGDAYAKLNARSKQQQQQQKQQQQRPQLKIQIPIQAHLKAAQRQTQSQSQGQQKRQQVAPQPQQQKPKSSRLSRPFDPMIPMQQQHNNGSRRETFDKERHGGAFAALNAKSKNPNPPAAKTRTPVQRGDQKAQVAGGYRKVQSESAAVQQQQRQREREREKEKERQREYFSHRYA